MDSRRVNASSESISWFVLLCFFICCFEVSIDAAASPGNDDVRSHLRHRVEVNDDVRSHGRHRVEVMRMKNFAEIRMQRMMTKQRESKTSEMHLKDPCRLPDCFPPKSGIPGGLPAAQTPQIVFFTFDDAVTPTNKPFYDRLFNDERKNPNGCPIRATFFNSYNYTVYSLVADLYKKGHEFGSHSITHREPPSWWEHATIEQYKEEIAGQRDNIHRFAGVPIQEIRGMRVPFLAMGADNQFTMLQQNNFTYDASMASRSDPPSWPFTLQQPDKLTRDLCSISPDDCPKKPYALWEVALNVLYMVGKTGNCTASMVDGCRPGPPGQPSKEEALDYLRLNFNRHHGAADKPPFGLNMHAAWFQFSEVYFDAMQEFVDEVLRMKDVWIVPAYKVIQWIRNPTPLSKLNTFEPFSCRK